jgi:hypothetical protein
MRFLALSFCWFFGGATVSLASEMPEDLAAYLQRQGTDREEKSLEEWLVEHGTERTDELQISVNPLGDQPTPLGDQPTPVPQEQGQLPTEQPPPFVPTITTPTAGPNMDWRLFEAEEKKPAPDATPTPQPMPFEPPETEPMPSPVALGKGKPLTVTLVQMLAEPSVKYTIAGCPPADPAPLKNDGVAPDTRADDQEITGIVGLCPLGETQIRFMVDGTEVWVSQFAQANDTEAPSLRILKSQDGFSIDTGGPEKKTHSPQHVVVLPQTEQDEPSAEPLTEPVPTPNNAVFWVGGIVVLTSIFVAWRYSSIPSTESPPNSPDTAAEALETRARAFQQPPPTPFPLPTELTQTDPGTHWISVKNATDQRSLTFALALHHCQNKTVFLLANPDNKKSYSRAFLKQNDVTWFNGKPPRVEEIKTALLELEGSIGIVILEGTSAIADRRQKSVQELLDHIQQPVFLIETAAQSLGSTEEQFYSVQEGRWRPTDTA